MGYAGGSTPNPTYHRLGDHTECIEIDYDPTVITYEGLLDVFWASHSPIHPAHSRQYMSAIFARDERQEAVAKASRDRVSSSLGTQVHTPVLRLERFYPAEDYHQKHRLRGDRVIMREFAEMYPDPEHFRDSTAAARVNGMLDGCGGQLDLENLLSRLGLSDEAILHLAERVRRRV